MYASHLATHEQVWKRHDKRTDVLLCACVYIFFDFILDLFTKITHKKFTQKDSRYVLYKVHYFCQL